MKISKLTILLGLFAFNSVAEDAYIIRIPHEVTLGTWTYEPPEYSEWRNFSEPYNCTDWTPEADRVEIGTEFEQEQTCSYDAERTVSQYKVNSLSGQRVLDKEELDTDTIQKTERRDQVGTMVARNMCIDILNRGDSVGNQVYTVDPDGSGPLPSRSAYCDMTGGGWTLYDAFGTKLVATGGTTPSAYNHRAINSTHTLKNAGYSYSLTTINTSQYARSDYYMQFFYSSSPNGYIMKTLPEWIDGVRVSTTNQWYSGTTYTTVGSVTKSNPGYAQHKYLYFSGTGKLKLLEGGIYWVDSVWVK